MDKKRYHTIYLHGFASGPGSRKARFFKDKLANFGIDMHIPDLNVPSFENLSIAAMLEKVKEVVNEDKNGSWVVFGSSLGAFVALQAAAVIPRIEKLVMIAPALGLWERREFLVGKSNLGKWMQKGTIEIYHHAYEENREISYSFMEEVKGYDPYIFNREMPMLIFHGAFDEIIPFETVEKFACNRNLVKYHLVESDHSLINKLDYIWREVIKFLELQEKKRKKR